MKLWTIIKNNKIEGHKWSENRLPQSFEATPHEYIRAAYFGAWKIDAENNRLIKSGWRGSKKVDYAWTDLPFTIDEAIELYDFLNTCPLEVFEEYYLPGLNKDKPEALGIPLPSIKTEILKLLSWGYKLCPDTRTVYKPFSMNLDDYERSVTIAGQSERIVEQIEDNNLYTGNISYEEFTKYASAMHFRPRRVGKYLTKGEVMNVRPNIEED